MSKTRPTSLSNRRARQAPLGVLLAISSVAGCGCTNSQEGPTNVTSPGGDAQCSVVSTEYVPVLSRITPFVWGDQALVAWRASVVDWNYPGEYVYKPFRTKVHLASIADTGPLSLAGTYDFGWVTPAPSGPTVTNIWSETQLAAVGNHLVAFLHGRLVVLSLPNLTLERSLDAPPINEAALLSIDQDSVMLAGVASDSPEDRRLAIEVLHLPDGTVESETSVAVSLGPSAEKVPCFEGCALPGASIALVRPDANSVLGAYVGADGDSIVGILLGLDGTQLAGPVTLAVSDRKLFLPSVALLAPGDVGMAWTGESGTEVRFRTFPSSLQDVDPLQEAIVNADTSSSQEWARVAPTGDGGGIIVWSSEPSSDHLMARYFLPAGPTRFAPDDDIAVTNQACLVGMVAASLVSTPQGVVAAWPGPTTVDGGSVSSIAARILPLSASEGF